MFDIELAWIRVSGQTAHAPQELTAETVMNDHTTLPTPLPTPLYARYAEPGTGRRSEVSTIMTGFRTAPMIDYTESAILSAASGAQNMPDG